MAGKLVNQLPGGELTDFSDTDQLIVRDPEETTGYRTKYALAGTLYDYIFTRISAVGGFQTSSPMLSGIVSLTPDGIIAKVNDLPVVRTITGTANEVSVSNGSGALGNPTVSLPSALTMTGKTMTGGAHVAMTGLGIRSTGASFDLTLASSEVLTAGRTLTITLGDAARTLSIGASASVSGSNTGDQTITLTGDVTGTGTGSFATTIGATKITFGMLNNSAITGATINNSVDTSNDYVLYYDDSAGALRRATVGSIATAATSGVSTFNGRTGAVTPASGDYAVADVTGAAASGANTDITSVALNQTGLAIKGGDANKLTIKPNETMTAGRTLNLITGDADRTITLGGNVTTAANFITSGANSLTLTTTGATNVTLPTTGTVATLAGSETLSGKTLTAPKVANAGFIADANGNEHIIFTTTASAVNEITYANAATGANPTITASGETNVGLTITGKGTKGVQVGNAFIHKEVTVSDGAGAVIDCSLGNTFNWTAAADRTAGTTTNAVSGQRMIINFTASGGARTLTLPTATTGDFAFGTDVTSLTQTASGKTDVIGCVYNSVKANRWAVVAVSKGY